jgi:hypothetical protein
LSLTVIAIHLPSGEYTGAYLGEGVFAKTFAWRHNFHDDTSPSSSRLATDDLGVY